MSVAKKAKVGEGEALVGEGLPASSPQSPIFFVFSSYLLKKKKFFLNKLSEGELPMGGRAGPDPLPGQRRDLGPAQACAGGPAAPGWRAGGRGIRPYRDVLAAACGEKAGGVSGAGIGWPTTARPLSTSTVPAGSPPAHPSLGLTSVKAS